MFNPNFPMETENTVILAMDWGERRIGLALSDNLRIMAHPYGTLENADGIYEDISELARERGVGLILLGLPLTLAGEEGEMAQRVREFGAGLSRQIPEIPVRYFDERLTTSGAEKALADMRTKGTRKKRRRKKPDVDAVAAALLLDTYLEFLKNRDVESETDW